ncbi:paraben-hydrolyzing esterase precursor [Lojkania enalia]|uniref:Carboxylic ester hydrolase n=1 Tax=Lojkania enalia TaxID=147567 RepID=A0A9P4MZS4_9PLEO|nr:paraben-hydrolyzing esterase precursor [Didymosphaeria enalia]
MRTTQEPYLRDLSFRGFVEGVTYKDENFKPLCHYFGGIPYALPPVRWQKPIPLPACYRYGTRENPGKFAGEVSTCPQPDKGSNKAKWDENCLQTNIWLPVGEPPEGGWPVLFWIHGGFLQLGSPNANDLSAMLSETTCKFIVVMPGYRINILGFLASPELLKSCSDYAVNCGFWDQRQALEWTWQNISYFGGNASNIAIGGYSAGAYSTFYQLAYDLQLPDSKSIVRRALMMSNGPGIQPKSLESAQLQFNEYLNVLHIPLTMTPQDKLDSLRAIDQDTLINAIYKMKKYHQFRSVTDGEFIRPGLLDEIDTGSFAGLMRRKGVKLLLGECKDEHTGYADHWPPNNYNTLFERLQADYPLPVCKALINLYYPDKELPVHCRDWKEAWGKIYADVQIHHLQRGMHEALVRHGAGDLVYRYRIEFRAECCDYFWPRDFGVTHTSDLKFWFWGDGNQLSQDEKTLLRGAIHELWGRFIKGEEVAWGTSYPLHIRTLTPEGAVLCQEDVRLNEGVKVWETVMKAGKQANSKL